MALPAHLGDVVQAYSELMPTEVKKLRQLEEENGSWTV
jgi:hypothetical protein